MEARDACPIINLILAVDDTGSEDESNADEGEAGDGPASDTGLEQSEDTEELPNTGTGPALSGSDNALLGTLLGGVAVLCGLAGMRLRRQP